MSGITRFQDPVREHVAGKMPATITLLIAQAKTDLWDGPLYTDQDGELCSPFDDTAKRFDFPQACIDIAAFFDNIGCLYLDEDSIVHTSEPTGDYYTDENPNYDPEDPDSEPTVEIYSEPVPYWEIGQHDIIRLVVGDMLAPYIA